MSWQVQRRIGGVLRRLGAVTFPSASPGSALSSWQTDFPVAHGENLTTSIVGPRIALRDARTSTIQFVTWDASYVDGPSWIVTGPISGVAFDANVIFDGTNAPYVAEEFTVVTSNTAYRSYDLRVVNGSSTRKVLLRNFEVLGNRFSGIGIGENHFTAVRGRIRGQGRDHSKLFRHAHLIECMLHERVFPANTAHYTDGSQTERGGNISIESCFIDLTYQGGDGGASTFAGVFWKPEDAEGIGSCRLLDTYIDGGKYSLAIVNNANTAFRFNGGSQSLVVRGNTFGIRSQFGAYHFQRSTGPDIEIDAGDPLVDWFDNTWAASGTHTDSAVGSVSQGAYIWADDPAGGVSTIYVDVTPDTVTVNVNQAATLTARIVGLPVGVTVSSWAWSDGAGFTSTTPTSISYSKATVDSYNVLLTLTLSDSSILTDVTRVTVASAVNPTARISGATSVQLNSSSTWTSITTGATPVAYRWIVSGVTVATTSSYTRTVNAAFTLNLEVDFVGSLTRIATPLSVVAPNGVIAAVTHGQQINELNTGIAALGYLHEDLPVGPSSSSSAGQVMELFRIDDGGLTIRHPNVLVRGVSVRRRTSGGSPSPNMIEIKAENVRVEFCTVDGGGWGKQGFKNVGGRFAQIYRCNLSRSEDGFKPQDDCTIVECFVHGNQWQPGGHGDVFQISGGGSDNVVLIRNHLRGKRWDNGQNINNAGLQLGSFTPGGRYSNGLLENNFWQGANSRYQNGDGSGSLNVTWKGNRFSTEYTQWPLTGPINSISSFDFDNTNVWSDGPQSGLPINGTPRG